MHERMDRKVYGEQRELERRSLSNLLIRMVCLGRVMRPCSEQSSRMSQQSYATLQ